MNVVPIAITIAMLLCTAATASEVFYHKGIRMHGYVHHVNTQEGWATVSAAEADGKHFKVWLRDLDSATRTRIGVATPAEALEVAQTQAAAQVASQLKEQAMQADMQRVAAQDAAANAQREAARQHAAQMEIQRQSLELQRRQTEAMEQAAFLQFLRAQQR